MGDQVFKSTVQVDDQGSDPLDRYRQAWLELKAAFEDTAKSTDVVNSAISKVEQEFAQSQAVADELAVAMHSVGIEAQNTASGLDTLAGAEGTAASGAQDLAGAAREGADAHRVGASAAHEHADAELSLTEIMEGASGGVSGMTGKLATMVPALAIVGEAFHLLTEYVNETTAAFANQETADTRLATAFKANAMDLEMFKGKLEEVKVAGEKLGFTDTEITAGLARITPFVHDANRELQILAAAENISAQTGFDLGKVMLDLGMSVQRTDEGVAGAGRTLRQYGIIVKDGTTSAEILRMAEEKYAGAAVANANTVAGAEAKKAAAKEHLMEVAGGMEAKARQIWEEEQTRSLEQLSKAAENKDFLAGIWGQLYGDLSKPIIIFPNQRDELEKLDETGNKAEETKDRVNGAFDDMVSGVVGNVGEIEKSVGEDAPASLQYFADVATAVSRDVGDEAQKMAVQQDDAAKITKGVLEQMAQDMQTKHDDVLTTLQDEVQQQRAKLAQINEAEIAADKIGGTFGANMKSYYANMATGIQAWIDGTAIPAINRLIAAQGGAGMNVPNTKTVTAPGLTWVHPPPDFSGENKPPPGFQGQFKSQQEVSQDIVDANAKKMAAAEAAARAAARKAAGGGAGSAEKAATAQAAYEAAKKKYDQDMAQLALEGRLADATDKTTAAKEHKKAVDDSYGTVLDALNASLDANAAAEKAAIAPLEAAAKAEQQAFDAMRAKNEEALHGIDVAIHSTSEELKKLEAIATQLEAPFEAALLSAQKAQQALSKEISAANEAFQDQKDAISDEQRLFEASAAAIMGPYNDALTAAQENVQALADKYQNQLLPIENELRDLQQAIASDDRSKQLANQAQEVGNLSARIANAVVGSREYNALVKQQADAEKALQRGERIDQLTGEKEAIEARRDVEMKAAQDAVTAAQKARDEEGKLLEQQRAALAERMAAVDREAELYNRQARDKQQFAQQDVDNAQAALTAQQARDAAMEASTKARLAGLQSERDAMAYNAQEAERTEGLIVAAKNAAVEAAKIPFETEKTRIGDMVISVKAQKDAQDLLNDSIIKGADINQKAVKAQLDLFRDNEKAAGIATAWANAQDKYATATAKLATGVTATSKAMVENYVPAIQGMATATDTHIPAVANTFLKYFGGPSDPNFDAAHSIEWLLDTHNTAGFWGRVNYQWGAAFGDLGMKGIVDHGLLILSQDFDTTLASMATIVGDKAAPVGASIDGGIAKGITDGTGTITAALIAAVEKALEDTVKHIEGHSPSERTARMIGEPMGLGVAVGIDRTAGHAATSMHNLVDGTVGYSVRGIGGGGAGGGYGDNSVRPLPTGDYSVGFGVGGVHYHVDNVHLHMPDVRQLPEDPAAYHRAARAISIAIESQMSRSGKPRLMTVRR